MYLNIDSINFSLGYGNWTLFDDTYILSDIRDPTGAIADALEEEYLHDLEFGNFEGLVPGMVDVNIMLWCD